jgi:hypothetical protein
MEVPCFGISSSFSAVRFAEEESRKMGMFRVFRAKGRRNFSAVETAWRSTQSGANSSPRKFPANREKYREFAKILLSKIHTSFL